MRFFTSKLTNHYPSIFWEHVGVLGFTRFPMGIWPATCWRFFLGFPGDNGMMGCRMGHGFTTELRGVSEWWNPWRVDWGRPTKWAESLWIEMLGWRFIHFWEGIKNTIRQRNITISKGINPGKPFWKTWGTMVIFAGPCFVVCNPISAEYGAWEWR